MSLVNTLMSGSGIIPMYESVSMDELFSGEAYDNYLESYTVDRFVESTVDDMIAVQEASLVADILGEVKVLREGANPQILMEGIFANIKDAIVTFFKKAIDFFKNLATGAKKKAEENQRNNDMQKLRDELSSIKKEMADNEYKNSLKNGTATIEIYEYNTDPITTYKAVSDGLIDKYNKAIDSYKTTASTILRDISTANNSYEKNYDRNKYDAGRNYGSSYNKDATKKTISDIDKQRSSANRFGYSDADDDVKAAKKMYDGMNSSKARHDAGYKDMSDTEKKEYDLNVERLHAAYEETKGAVIGGIRLTDEETKMGEVEYIKYLMRGKNKEKTKMTMTEALALFSGIAGVDLTSKNADTDVFEEFCVNGIKSPLYKPMVKIISDQTNAIVKLKQDTLKIVNDCESKLKEGEGYDNIKQILSKITSYVTEHVRSVIAIARVPGVIIGEMAASARALYRLSIETLKAVKPGEFEKNYDTLSDWEKEQHEKAMRESTGLFEQAYSLGLF